MAVPLIQTVCQESPGADAALVLGRVLDPLNAALSGTVAAVRWKLTPYYSIQMSPPTATAPHSRSSAGPTTGRSNT